MSLECTSQNVTITPLAYGPTPLHTDQGEQAFYTFRVDSSDPTATYTNLKATIDIQDALGNVVRTLSTDVSNRIGVPVTLAWDGKDTAGKLVPPGDYAPTFNLNGNVKTGCQPGSAVHASAIFCSGLTIPPPRRKPPNGDGGDNNTSNDNNNMLHGGGGGGGGSSSTSKGNVTYKMFAVKLPDDTTDSCSDVSTDPTPISPGSSEMYNFTTDANGNITLNLLDGFDISRPIQSLDLSNGFSMPSFHLDSFNMPTFHLTKISADDLLNGFLWPSFHLPKFSLSTTLDLTNGWSIPTLNF